jgi:hypothetical protein
LQINYPQPKPHLDPKDFEAESLALNISPFKESSNNLEVVVEGSDSPLKFSIPNSQNEDSDGELQGPYAKNKKKFELLMTDVQRPNDFNLRSMKGTSRYIPPSLINLQ